MLMIDILPAPFRARTPHRRRRSIAAACRAVQLSTPRSNGTATGVKPRIMVTECLPRGRVLKQENSLLPEVPMQNMPHGHV